jgi:hypothetical protein
MEKESLAAKNRRLVDKYRKENPIKEMSKILAVENTSPLWDKPKPNWNITDWREFFRIKYLKIEP